MTINHRLIRFIKVVYIYFAPHCCLLIIRHLPGKCTCYMWIDKETQYRCVLTEKAVLIALLLSLSFHHKKPARLWRMLAIYSISILHILLGRYLLTQLMLDVYVIVFPSSVSYLKANKTHLTGFCVVYIKTYVRSSKRKEKKISSE